MAQTNQPASKVGASKADGSMTAGSKVVTVSATYGAGGSIVAPKLAALLGLPFFDRLVHVQSPQTPDERVERIVERLTKEEHSQAPSGRLMASLTHLGSGLGLPTSSPDDMDPRRQLRRRVEDSVTRIATEPEGGVILGRAAAVVLAAAPRAFHVRLHGPVDRCRAQGAALEGVTDEVARVHQHESDRAWTRFVTRLFDREPGDPKLYHLMIDSTAVPLDRCVELIAVAANGFWER